MIGGSADAKDSRTGIGALSLGVHDTMGELRCVGDIGNGFNERTLSRAEAPARQAAAGAQPVQ